MYSFVQHSYKASFDISIYTFHCFFKLVIKLVIDLSPMAIVNICLRIGFSMSEKLIILNIFCSFVDMLYSDLCFSQSYLWNRLNGI